MQKNGIDPSELCVVSDDIDLPLGTLRMRPQGSAGGQKGMRSIVRAPRDADFPRLRVGVRGERYSPGAGPRRLRPRALLAKRSGRLFEDAVGRAVETLRVWLSDGIDAAMRSANRKPSSPDGASRPD